MNIQIFGTGKSFDTKKAERYFKERGIRCQMIDLKEKGISRGELISVIQSVHGIENLLDPSCRDQDALALVRYIADEQKLEKLLENPQVMKLPIVRNGKRATVGYKPEIWKEWKDEANA